MYPLCTSMLLRFFFLSTVFASLVSSAVEAIPPSAYPVDEYIFNATIDHFNFRPTTVPTFPLRFYVNQQHWNGSSSPVLFYTGNEADIFQFINNSGFLFETAVDLSAMVVFAEHRYYGLSNPFGNENALGVGYNISFLTVEQAMQDFNTLQLYIRNKWKLSPDAAFIAAGGSYGGNLAMWLRLKNPNLWAGAIASSATPLKHLLRQTNGFHRIETEVYGNVSKHCPELIRLGWKELYENAKSISGRAMISAELGLCEPLPDEGAANDIHDWIDGALETMVQYGYPYPTSFYNPLPGYPFKVVCDKMIRSYSASNSKSAGLGALRAAAEVYYNYTGAAGDCFDFEQFIIKESAKYLERTGKHEKMYAQHIRWQRRTRRKIKKSRTFLDGDSGMLMFRFFVESDSKNFDDLLFPLSSLVAREKNREEEKDDLNKWSETNRAWGYQTCTEVYQPMPTDGVTDFEVPYQPNQTAYYEHCRKKWNVEPRPGWEEMTFMGNNIQSGSNIFLSSGQLDPWRAAGIQKSPKGNDGSIIVRIIENGAHHLDLRGSHKLDPPSVVTVRREERAAMRQWIRQWKENHS